MPRAGPKRASDAAQERLDALAREYRPALTRFFRKRATPAADVDDLVQEVLLRLAVRGDADAIDRPEAYLMRSASNVWRDHLRKLRTHAQGAHEEYSEERHAVPDHGPVDALQATQSIETLVAILHELPARTLQVFVLCRVEGMRQKSVARRLGVSVSAVEKHMIKAIAHLALRLEQVQ